MNLVGQQNFIHKRVVDRISGYPWNPVSESMQRVNGWHRYRHHFWMPTWIEDLTIPEHATYKVEKQ